MLTTEIINEVVQAALIEDVPESDITSEYLIPGDAVAVAELVAREPGVFSGVAVFIAAFKLTNPSIKVEMKISDGERFEKGQQLATITGNAQSVLTAERVGLNFIQRMCGIATLTAKYVEKVSTTKAVILDTRKTTPGLRAFERQAVLDGGGQNHRFSLSDQVMVKDNHLAVLAKGGKDLTAELRLLRNKLSTGIKIEVEVDRLDQISMVLAAKVDIILFDNFTLEDLRTGVELVDRQCLTEASGGVNLDTVAEIAQTGVDRISVGALTHSSKALDLGLDIKIS